MSTSKSKQNTVHGNTNSLQPNAGMYRPQRMMETPDARTAVRNNQTSEGTPEKQRMDKKKLRELFNYQLRDMQQAEERMAKSLPVMMKHATRQELVKNVDAYLEQTKEQIKKLNMLAQSIGENSMNGEKEVSSYLIEDGGNIVQKRARIVRPRVMSRPAKTRINQRQK